MKSSTNTSTHLLGFHLLLLVALLLSSCQSGVIPGTKTTNENRVVSAAIRTPVGELGETYPVDPLFQELYTLLDSKAHLGPAISQVIHTGNVQQQYVEAGLLVFDPLAPNNERYRLAPLGLEFDVSEPLSSDSNDPGMEYLSGHVIYPPFLELYEAMGGARYVGLPLTDTHYNQDKHRFEQYFENLGFYLPGEDPGGEVCLMAYGAFACDQRCRYQSPNDSIPGEPKMLPAPFELAVRKIGLEGTGRVIAGPSLAEDGRQETIFENLVLVLDRNVPGGILVQPMVEMLGIVEEPLVEPRPDPLMEFIEIDNGLGHNVPRYFMEFIKRHGGFWLSGFPISEVHEQSSGIYRQYFANLSLEFDLNQPEGTRLSLVPLGYLYKDQYYRPEKDFERSQRLDNAKLLIYETISDLRKNQSQTIVVTIYQDGFPLKNREPILLMKLPDGSQPTYRFPPTDENGKTSLTVPPINNAPRYTMIPYEVCLEAEVGRDQCKEENFAIWK